MPYYPREISPDILQDPLVFARQCRGLPAYKAGNNAYFRSVPLSGNPYAYSMQVARTVWYVGWLSEACWYKNDVLDGPIGEAWNNQGLLGLYNYILPFVQRGYDNATTGKI